MEKYPALQLQTPDPLIVAFEPLTQTQDEEMSSVEMWHSHRLLVSV